jgi:hypothetical protein
VASVVRRFSWDQLFTFFLICPAAAGLSQGQWDALDGEARCQLEREAADRLTEAFAHFISPSLTVWVTLSSEIERRLATGEKP